MSARIQSTVNLTPGGIQVGGPVLEASREDLRKGNEVILTSLDVATTYAWTLAFTPASANGTSSVAALLAPENANTQTARFVVDYEGAYLVRLVVDQGLPTESTQFIRARRVTKFGNIKLIAAGERRDETGTIPVDASPEGWSNEQNENVQRLLGIMRRTATSGRVLYVDSNRGRDRSANSDDETNTFELPGSDTSDTADDLIMTAEKHGDFTTIGEALTYALGSVGRGEPAPSQAEPWIIKVAPGLYVEDLAFQPFVHVYGSTPQWALGVTPALGQYDVVLRTANAAGQTHRFQPALDTDVLHLVNLRLENIDGATTTPVLLIDRGHVHMRGCVVTQETDGVAVGPAVLVEDGANAPVFTAWASWFVSKIDNDDDDACLKFNAPDMVIDLNGCSIESIRTGIEINRDLYEQAAGQVDIHRSTVSSSNGIAVRAYSDTLIDKTILVSDGRAIVADGFGGAPGSKVGSVVLTLTEATYVGQVTVDDSQAAGTVTVQSNAISQPSTATPFIFTTGTPTMLSDLRGYSLRYDPAWADYDGATLAVTAPAQLSASNTVQEALDNLVNLALPLGIAPFYSLTSAYNGLASPSPPVIGAGLGRSILADDGAVQITGALSPTSTATGIDPLLSGGHQIEGQLDVGPVATDGLGSEFSFLPSTFGFGPVMRMGRTVYPTGFATLRPFPSALIVAGAADGTVQEDNAWNLRLRVKDKDDSAQAALGHVYVQASTRMDSGNVAVVPAGSTYVMAGNQLVAAGGVAGDVALVPGMANAGTSGRVRVVCPATATAAFIDANAVFPADPLALGGGGTYQLLLQTDDGTMFSVTLLDGDTQANVITKINTACGGKIIASQNVGVLRLTSGSLGESSDVGVVGDIVPGGAPGDLLVALGELRLASGATLTLGTYPDEVEIECTADGVLTVHGVIVTGAAGYSHTAINLTVTTEEIVGVDTLTNSPGQVDITLPAAAVGRKIVIKDEAINAGTVGDEINVQTPGAETIDGAAAPFVLNSDSASVSLYSDGTNWFIY